MSDPRRLLEDGSELERLLLSSALTVRPRAWSRWRAAALFFFASLGATSLAKGAGAALAKTQVGALRWAFIGLGGGAVALTGAQLLQREEPLPKTPVVMDQPAPRPKGDTAPSQAAPMDQPRPTPEAERAVEGAAPAPSTAALSASSGKRAPAPNAALLRELEALDSASQALSAGRSRRALEALDSYQRAFPRGAMAEEALRLRIEATQASGNRAAAVRLAREFSRRYPKSAYAQRLRSLLDAP